jgi:exosortase
MNHWLDNRLVREYGPMLPLVAALAAVPYAVIYLFNLWGLAHYQFFPLVIGAVGWLVVQRWDGAYQGTWSTSAVRFVLLSGGVLGTLCATLFASAWMGFFGFAFSLAAWLSYQRDADTGRSLAYLALPVMLIWQPPWDSIVTADAILIQTLQSLSAKLSSQWLDILGYAHHQPGTVLEFAGRSFGVAEACSGIQSFFAVFCFGALLIVYLRRNLWLGLLLLATCPCWALLMNTIRITAIPIAYTLFGIDLSHGFLHDLLGYCTMALALGLLLSTDELLLKVVELLPSSVRGLLGLEKQHRTADALQLSPAGAAPKSGAALPSRPRPVLSKLQLLYVVPLTGLLVLGAGIQLYDIRESWGQSRHIVDFFRDEPLVEMVVNDAPQELAGWAQIKYGQETRGHGNDDLGERSDLWHYEAPFGTAIFSFDQMFPGWHELTRCYRNAGWNPVQRSVLEGPEVDDWPIVVVQLARNNEHGYLVFSEVDRSGKYLQPPGEYSYWTILQERLRGRLTPAVRGALFSAVAYQAQAFVSTYTPLDDSQQAAVLERFKSVRGQLWNAAQQRLE